VHPRARLAMQFVWYGAPFSSVAHASVEPGKMPVGRTNNDDRRGLAGIASAARPTPKRGRSPAVAKEGLVGRITSRPARRGWQKGADHCVPPRPSTRLELGGSGVMVRNFRTLDHPATRPSAAKTRGPTYWAIAENGGGPERAAVEGNFCTNYRKEFILSLACLPGGSLKTINISTAAVSARHGTNPCRRMRHLARYLQSRAEAFACR